jgi:hypothetical protein
VNPPPLSLPLELPAVPVPAMIQPELQQRGAGGAAPVALINAPTLLKVALSW